MPDTPKYISKINVRGEPYYIKSSYDDNTAHNFADIYDPAHSGAYSTGDLVVYDGTLYKYISDTPTSNPPGPFDSSKWGAVTVEGEFKKIQTIVSDPTASSTATSFIATASQNVQGVISVTKKALPFSNATPAANGTGSAGSADTIARGDHVHPKGPATTADSLATARYIDGVSFNGSADIAHYGESASGASEATKIASCTGFDLKDGARIVIKFNNGNTMAPGSTLKLNINNKGAKDVKYKGITVITASQLPIGPNSVYEFVYDSSESCFHFVGDVTTTINASNITGILPVAHGGTGSNSFDSNDIVMSNNDGSALVSYGNTSYATNYPLYPENLQALFGAGTVPGQDHMIPLQQQINEITGGGYDHIRFASEDAVGNAVPAYIVSSGSTRTCNFDPSDIYGGYALSVGDLIVGRDGSLGKVTSISQSGVATAEYLGILFGVNVYVKAGQSFDETLYVTQNAPAGDDHWTL